jgi:hypothetical protein
MRQMISSCGTVLNIVEHIMTRQYWEYYITDENFTEDIVCALVHGFETDIGNISLLEIKPYIMTRTKNLDEVMPAQGWRWK